MTRADTTSDTTAIAAATGTIASPVCSADSPSTWRRYSTTRNWKPNAAATSSICTTFAPERVREANSRNGSNGLAAFAWRTRNAASSSSANAARTRVRGRLELPISTIV